MTDQQHDSVPDQQELDAIDQGVDPRAVLSQRVERAEAEQIEALAELRTVMSDADALEVFGIHVDQS